MEDGHFFDSLETRAPAERESEQFELLVKHLHHAKAKAHDMLSCYQALMPRP